MLKLASFLSLLLLTSCFTTPGLKEPVVVSCRIIDDVMAECSTLGSDVVEERPLVELIGFSAVSPSHEADIANHHEALHFRIKELEKKKCSK